MSHITARASLATAVVAAAMLAGCSAGRDDNSPFVPDTPSAPQAAAPVVSGAAPVVPAAPAAAPVVSGAATGQAKNVESGGASADPAVRRAVHQRKVARREAREAKARERRAKKRAEARQAFLRGKLREARRQEALTAQRLAEATRTQSSKPKSDGNKISGTSVDTKADRDRRSDTEARAAVVRYHELLDNRDASACDLLTKKMLHSFYGDDEAAAERCRSGVEAINTRVSVQILRSAASGPNALLDTVTYLGDGSVHQGLAMALVDGTWKIDVVKPLDS